MSLVNHPIKKESNNAGSLTKQYMSINIDCLEIKLNMGQKKKKKNSKKISNEVPSIAQTQQYNKYTGLIPFGFN